MEVTLKNLDINELVEFDNVNYILNEIITDNCAIEHGTSKTIKQIGEYITSTNVNSRSISIIGYIFASSKLDMISKKEKLLNITSPFSEVQVIINNKYQILGKCEELVNWAVGYDNNNDMFAKFTINVLCPGTMWLELEPTIVTLDSYIDEFKYPLAIPMDKGMIFAKQSENTICSVYNQCNIEIPMTITLTAFEDVESIKISNTVTDEFFEINLYMKAGQILEINSQFGNKSVLLDGQNVIGSVNLIDSTWLMLNPGLNKFVYQCNNGENHGFDATIQYYKAYWGIAS